MFWRRKTVVPGTELQPLGLIRVATPPDEIAPTVDIIFVHGLGGGARKTWSKNRDLNFFWPEKFLPQEIPTARVYCFGYNANFASRAPSAENVVDFGRELLRTAGTSTDQIGVNCPVLIIAHSMGGLVTKEAILQSKAANDGFSEKVKGIVFLGTPHRGSLGADKIQRMLELSPFHYRRGYVDDLKRNSENLERINEKFRNHASEYIIYSLYETLLTSVGIKKEMIVATDSSYMGYPGELVSPLYADHHDICKFYGRNDPNYHIVIGSIKDVLRTHTEAKST